MTQVAYQLTRLVEKLGGERSGTYTGAVGLHDAIHLANLVGSDAQSGASAGTDGVGGGNERIAAEVDVEHCSLRTLAKDTLARTQ